MEYLERVCPKCGVQRFTGRKTYMGMSEADIVAYRKWERTCARCGRQDCTVRLDHTSPEAAEFDKALGGLLGSIFGKEPPA